ncbi:MAG: PulJ/GspJ family protein [Flagellimonas sp.]
MKRIKAFTLNEMLVVLLITALVVGMAFSVLKLVQVQMQGISSNYEKNTELNLLRQSLWVDFNRFDRVWYDGNERKIVFVNEVAKASYQILPEAVIKEKDTFRIQIPWWEVYFNGETVGKGEIDAIDLYIGTEEEVGKRVFVFKRNAATSYINQ